MPTRPAPKFIRQFHFSRVFLPRDETIVSDVPLAYLYRAVRNAALNTRRFVASLLSANHASFLRINNARAESSLLAKNFCKH